ncbi:MAG TPA: 3'-5' exonuclease [Polyangiaceae bacterium]|nr:3'-5' exonuclease [Polyangiaceae bacterium]
MKVLDPCGCFPTGRHYPGIAHLIRVRAIGVAEEIDAELPWVASTIAFIDTETTGRDPLRDRIVEVGIVLGRHGEVIERRSWLIDPEIPIPEETSAVHGIRDEDVRGKPRFPDVLAEIAAMLEGAVPAAYNAAFDKAFMLAELDRSSDQPEKLPPALRRTVEWLDPLVFAREIYKDEQSRALGEMAQRLGIELERAHRATDDAEAALRVLYALGKDPRLPRGYAALLQEQRRLARLFDEARRFWRKPS